MSSDHNPEIIAVRIVMGVVCTNADRSAAGLRDLHNKIKGAMLIAIAMHLDDAQAELERLDRLLWDARDQARVHEWDQEEITDLIVSLVERVR